MSSDSFLNSGKNIQTDAQSEMHSTQMGKFFPFGVDSTTRKKSPPGILNEQYLNGRMGKASAWHTLFIEMNV